MKHSYSIFNTPIVPRPLPPVWVPVSDRLEAALILGIKKGVIFAEYQGGSLHVDEYWFTFDEVKYRVLSPIEGNLVWDGVSIEKMVQL